MRLTSHAKIYNGSRQLGFSFAMRTRFRKRVGRPRVAEEMEHLVDPLNLFVISLRYQPRITTAPNLGFQERGSPPPDTRSVTEVLGRPFR